MEEYILNMDEKSKSIINFIKDNYKELYKNSPGIDKIVLPLEDISKHVFHKSNEETNLETLQLLKNISITRYKKTGENGYVGIFSFWDLSLHKYDDGEIACIFLLSRSFESEIINEIN